MQWIIGIILSYLLGSIPFGYVIVQFQARKDIRTEGSGNIGATNVYRVLGFWWAVAVFLLDGLKGVLAVYAIPLALGDPAMALSLACGISAVLGHMYTFFLKFKGGKGVAVAVGVIIGLGLTTPAFLLILLAALGVWFVVFKLSRYVSLASIVAALTFFVLTLLFVRAQELKLFAFIVMVFIVLRHRQNIQRLLQGKELRL